MVCLDISNSMLAEDIQPNRLERAKRMLSRLVDNLDNVSVRQESVSLISGAGLKDFSVIVGSFGLISNAEGLQQKLKAAGYDAQIVKNEDKNMFRVVASTFADKASAVSSRDQLRETYPDAWLLYSAQ